MLKNYYDQLSPHYQYIHQDWNLSVQRQAEILDGIIRQHFGSEAHTLLDAACGIGTQCIGLAEKGYHVAASDISSVSIEEARSEAKRRKLVIDFEIVDMRQVWNHFGRAFDVVIACDNAIPHLLSDEDILQAFEQFYRCTQPGGGCIISVRDYAAMERGGSKLVPRTAHETPDGKIIIFDYWKFDGDFYDFTTYIVEDRGKALANTHVIQGGRYYCVSISRLEVLMAQAGYAQVVTLRDGFYQPLLIGSRPPARG